MCVFNRFINRNEVNKIRVMENQLRFYEWMLKVKSIHLADNLQMSKAFEAIAENDSKIIVKKVVSLI